MYIHNRANINFGHDTLWPCIQANFILTNENIAAKSLQRFRLQVVKEKPEVIQNSTWTTGLIE
jgi:hypothetical protein